MADEFISSYECLRSEFFSFLEPRDALEALPPELELQSRWFSGEFGRHFLDTEGNTINIKDFGIWNHGAGPDFLNVTLEISGKSVRGDLEMDTALHDWENHGHAFNPNYNSVVLHLFFQASSKTFFTRTSEHRKVPQVQLSLEMMEKERRQKNVVPRAHFGRCARPLEGMKDADLNQLLLEAASLRFHRKAARFQRNASIHGWSQTWYQGFAEALGYHQNQIPMKILSQRVPLKVLSKDPSTSEAMLFGFAGFLDHARQNLPRNPEACTRSYLRQLWDEWWKIRGSFGIDLRPIPWVYHGNRPLNHPHRRLGALAAMVMSWKNSALENEDMSELVSWLSHLSHPFWTSHFSFKSAPARSTNHLIGTSRLNDLIVNLWFPLQCAQNPGSQEKFWAAYLKFPALQENQNSERAQVRLFGSLRKARRWQTKAWQQQGMLQIYEDFCLVDGSECHDCPFPEQLRQFPRPISLS